MSLSFTIKPIAYIKNDFSSKFGIPRQSGLSGDMRSFIVFEPQFRAREALRGIEQFSHLWLIWRFSETPEKVFSPTVRPPRLGGNKRIGVFATRSPFRPNSLGLSSVRLIGVVSTKDQGDILEVAGADLMNGTPIFDIKPYISYTDCHPDAVCGFADEAAGYSLNVIIPKRLCEAMPPEKLRDLYDILKSDPRPSYQSSP